MTELINVQLNMLIVALALGFFMGVSYDGLRCVRRIIAHNIIAVSIEDFVYWFVWTLIVIHAVVKYNYGELRIYILVALLVGFIIYRTTIGWVLMRLFNYMWCPIKNCLHNAKKNLKKHRKDSKI